MSTVLIPQEQGGISLTRYSRGDKGYGYQVTWGIDRWVSFDNEDTARAFRHMLFIAVERG